MRRGVIKKYISNNRREGRKRGRKVKERAGGPETVMMKVR